MKNHFRSASELAIVEILGIGIFAALVALLANYAKLQISGNTLIIAGIVLAIVPALLWIMAFYRQDLEPEPKAYVFGMFLLGAVLAKGIGEPVIRDLFAVQNWIFQNTFLGFLASILIIGMVQEFIKYAAVRYTIYNATEFDQPVDGIIYCASAGLGYATALNINYILTNGGVDLGVGAIVCAVEALAQASTAGVVGYFLGQAKFRKMGPLWLPVGLLVAAALNGVISMTLELIPQLGTFGFNAWAALITAIIIAGGIFFFLLRTMQRLNRQTVARSL